MAKKKTSYSDTNTDSAPAIDAATVKSLYDKGTQAIRAEQMTYLMNQCFLDNEQWVYLNNTTGAIENVRKKDDKVYATVNRVLPNSVHIAAKVLSRLMKFQVLPADTDDGSVKGASTGESILNSLTVENGWENYREEIFWAAWTGGTGFLALDWDAQAGETITTPLTNQPVGTGEICLTPLDITEVCWTPGAKDIERAAWWIRAQALPPEEVRNYYELSEMPEPDVNSTTSPLVKSLSQKSIGSVKPELTLVLTYYERPSFKNPQGRIATVVNDKVVGDVKAWYFPWKDRLNIKVFRAVKAKKRATGTTVLTSAIPIQVLLNASESSIQEHMKKAANVRTWYAEGAINPDDVSNTANEYVPYDPIWGKPQQDNIQEQASWWIQRPDKLSMQIDDIMGVHGVSRGDAPNSIQSGLGLSMLLEADQTPLGAMVKELALGWQSMGSMILRLYADKVTESRKAVVRSPQGVPEVRTWTGKSLQNQFDVNIPLDSVMPRDHASMQQFAQTLVQQGMVTDLAAFLRISEAGHAEDIIATINPDKAKAERVVNLLSQGIPVVPQEFDNHAIHIDVLHTFMKSARYDSLPPELQLLFVNQVQAHVTMAAEQAGQQVLRANTSPVLAQLPTTDGATPLPPGPVNPQMEPVIPPAPQLPPQGGA